jgi:hypothetical protein
MNVGTMIAVLDVLGERLPITSEAHSLYVALRSAIGDLPSRPEPERPEVHDVPWSRIAPGDDVLAPDGQWYGIDSICRIGELIKVILRRGEDTVTVERPASERMTARRGEAGQAIDLFNSHGIELETV